MAKFSIEPKEKGRAKILIRVRRKIDEHKEIDNFINTLLYCDDAREWRNNTGKNKMSDRFRKDNKELFDKLDSINTALEDLMDSGIYDKQSMEKAVSDIVNKELHEQQEREKQQKEQERIKAKQEQQAARLNVLNYYHEFYQGITSGDIRHGNDETYSKGSIQIWKEFGIYLTDFCKGKHITFETIDKKTADKFSKFLEVEKGLMPKTVVKNIICFRKLCNHAAESGINRNAVSLKVWKERRIKDEQMKAQTYLNADELQALYDIRLTGDREKVRDMFLLGTLLCQRYSDYMNLFADNFDKPLEDGTRCCRLTQKKTGAKVVIPFYDSKIESICNKYDYKFPHNRETDGEGKNRYLRKNDGDFSLNAFNRYLKDIVRQLAESVPSLNDMFTTALTAGENRHEGKYRAENGGKDLFQRNDKGEVVKPKWDIITGHSARRSGITNLYNRHVLTNREIMRISGHATESIFLHYIKTGQDEEAMETARKLRESN